MYISLSSQFIDIYGVRTIYYLHVVITKKYLHVYMHILFTRILSCLHNIFLSSQYCMIEVFTNGTRRQGCKRTTPLKIKIDCMTYCFNRFNHGVSRDNFCCLRNWTLYPLGLLHQKCYDPWWRHQMETFSALLALSAGISPVTGELPSQSHWDGALIFF